MGHGSSVLFSGGGAAEESTKGVRYACWGFVLSVSPPLVLYGLTYHYSKSKNDFQQMLHGKRSARRVAATRQARSRKKNFPITSMPGHWT